MPGDLASYLPPFFSCLQLFLAVKPADSPFCSGSPAAGWLKMPLPYPCPDFSSYRRPVTEVKGPQAWMEPVSWWQLGPSILTLNAAGGGGSATLRPGSPHDHTLRPAELCFQRFPRKLAMQMAVFLEWRPLSPLCPFFPSFLPCAHSSIHPSGSLAT